MDMMTLLFTRLFLPGTLLEGIKYHDRIRFVSRDRAAAWVRGIRRNTRRGVLDYKLVAIEARGEDR